MTNEVPSKEFLNSLRWILSESGQMLRLESSASIFIRSLEGGEWCVGSLGDDGSIQEETSFVDVDAAIDQYVQRINERNDW